MQPLPNKPIHILHIIESLGRGGAERQLVNLIAEIDRKCFDLVVVCLNGPTEFALDIESQNIKWISLNAPQFFQIPLVIGQLISIIHGVRPDIVHTWLSRADFAGRMAAFLCRVPVISSIQSPIYEEHVFINNPQQKSWKMQIVRVLDWLTGRISNAHYVGCSQNTSQSAQRALAIKAAYIYTIYNSVKSKIDDNPYLQRGLVIVGRLAPEKGHKYLLSAVASVKETFPEITLDIIGNGNLYLDLIDLTKSLQIEHHVNFLGIQQNIENLLKNYRIFVFPSLFEGLPLALLEAMAVGLPVIASDIPPHREIIDHGVQGILVPPQNPEALAQAIIELLNDAERCKRMGEAGRRRIAERFNIRVTVKQWEQLYRKLVNQ